LTGSDGAVYDQPATEVYTSTEGSMLQVDVRRLAVEPLDAAAFAPFGSVVQPGDADDPTLNRAPGHMAYMWVHQQLQYPKPPFIATCRYHARGARCEYLQRHPASTVVLIPLDGKPSVVWVAPDRDGAPEIDRVRAVLLDGRRGIVVNPGIWLRYAYPVLDTADFAYVSARDEPEDDIERRYLERDDHLVLEWYLGPPPGDGVETTPGGAVTRLRPPDGRDLEMGVAGRIVRPPGPDESEADRGR
jgi:ureidoglycolate lyase